MTKALCLVTLLFRYPWAAQDQLPVFRSEASMVVLPVVVRDGRGRPVENLRREDFRLWDRGAPQRITSFSVERWGVNGGPGDRSVPAAAPNEPRPLSPGTAAADRFVAYLFDDVHLRFDHLPGIRTAALRTLDTMRPGERAAIFTTSGRTMLEFTSDRESLRKAIEKVQARSVVRDECLDLDYYVAQLVDHGDRAALAAARETVMACYGLEMVPGLDQMITMAARQRTVEGALETRLSLTVLRNVIRRLATAPGQRTVVLVSEGFYVAPGNFDQDAVFDAAARANVAVNCLNSRGLIAYAPGNRPASMSGTPLRSVRNFQRESDIVNDGVLAGLAEATGGTFFHNNNDYEAAFRQLAGVPEVRYVLGFSPRNLEFDGKFHTVKVALTVRGLNVTARRGYYASARMADPEKAAKQEIEDALYSRAEIKGIPFELRNRVYKSPDGSDAVEISAMLDPKDLRMRKEGGVNRKPLSVAFGLFDADGNVLAATTKDVGLQIRDLDLQMMSGPWVPVRTTFALKPGGYSVRVVVRDGEEQLVAAQSGTIEIPGGK